MYDNIRYADESRYQPNCSFGKIWDKPRNITITLQPETYYIRVYSYSGSNDTAYYILSLNVRYTATTASISQLRFDKGASAAWFIRNKKISDK